MKHLIVITLFLFGVAGCDRAIAPTATTPFAAASTSIEVPDGDYPPLTCTPVVRFDEWSLPRGADEYSLHVVENNINVPKDTLPTGKECALFLNDLRGVINVENSHADPDVPELYIRTSTVMNNILVRRGAVIAFDYSTIYGNINCQPGGIVWFYQGAGPLGGTHGNSTVYGQISPQCTVKYGDIID